MQVSKKRISRNLENQFYRLLYQVLADINNPREMEVFLKDLLKETEIKIIARRLAIAHYLDKGRSYEEIKSNLAVSSATISHVVEEMRKKKGFAVALKKIRADEWAEGFIKKINNTFRIKK